MTHRSHFPAMPKPFPSLFGRFTAIVREHERLAPTLAQVRELSHALQRVDGVELPDEFEPAPLMAALYAELSSHFSAEEAPAYFGTVAAEGGDLKRQVDALCDEHAAMLETAAALVELARDASRSVELAALALELLERLGTHERNETALLSGFFGRAPRTASR